MQDSRRCATQCSKEEKHSVNALKKNNPSFKHHHRLDWRIDTKMQIV